MKIIISHDVDHLYAKDHLFRDMIFPKMWVRGIISFFKRRICFKTLISRMVSIFEGKQNRIEEVMKKDKQCNIPSVFFFGMNQGLGMSYKPEEAVNMIHRVMDQGFDVGVHGIDYLDIQIIRKEHDTFKSISGLTSFGIRTHYVRYDGDTFEKFNQAGYLYDTSEFNKENQAFKAPYKVGHMWEFPLHIMEGYIIPPEELEQGKKKTIEAICAAKEQGMPYCTILFHDSYYSRKKYPTESKWYDWLIEYLMKNEYEFISYSEAIKELEA